MQHRQAVQAADPAALAQFLELLIGTAPLAEQLGEVEREAAAKASAYDEEEERIAEWAHGEGAEEGRREEGSRRGG